MRSAFEISPGTFGNGPLLTCWGKGSLLAVASGKRQVALLNQEGIEQHSFGIDSPNVKGAVTNKQTIAVHAITWSSDGTLPWTHSPLQNCPLQNWTADSQHMLNVQARSLLSFQWLQISYMFGTRCQEGPRRHPWAHTSPSRR